MDYLANRPPLAIAPFKVGKAERERATIDLFEVVERGSVWEIEEARSLADWDESPGRTARVVVWGRGTLNLGRCLLAVDLRTVRCWPLTRRHLSPTQTDGHGQSRRKTMLWQFSSFFEPLTRRPSTSRAGCRNWRICAGGTNV